MLTSVRGRGAGVRDGATGAWQARIVGSLLAAGVFVIGLTATLLTVAALRSRGIDPTGLIIGSWPTTPGLAETTNRVDLPAHTGVPVVGVLPENAGSLAPEEFRDKAPGWFS